MRFLTTPGWTAALLTACGIAACGAEEPGRPAAPARGEVVVVRVDPDGPEGPRRPVEQELRCNPGTTDPACATLAAAPRTTWAPVPGDRACTQLYGGPQTARVTGEVGGRRVDARLTRRNGCEIARWDTLAPLFERVVQAG